MSLPTPDPRNSSPSNLGWPLVTMVLGLLAAVTIISVSGAPIKDLTDVLSLILSASGAAGGIGAWVNSTRAARQTNGALDHRMAASVQTGLAKALDDAQRSRKKAAAHAAPKPPGA